MKAFVRRAVDIMVLALVTFLLVCSALYANDGTGRDCPEQIGEGVVCSGPQASLTWLPQIQRDSLPCPLPIGEGALCRGPEVPDGVKATGPGVSALAEAEGTLFIPVLSR